MFNTNQTKSVFWLTLFLGASIICLIVWSGNKKVKELATVAQKATNAKSKLTVKTDEKVQLTK